MVEAKWAKSQSKSGIPSRTIVEGEIIVGGINCLVVEAKWAGSQSNCGAWVVTLLSKTSILNLGLNLFVIFNF